MAEERQPVTDLECPVCGDVAITSPTGWWHEDEGEACQSCGVPGHVNIEGDGDDAYAYWWTVEDEPAEVEVIDPTAALVDSKGRVRLSTADQEVLYGEVKTTGRALPEGEDG